MDLDKRRPYQSIILDILFWHSVIFDADGFAQEVRRDPVTMEDVRGERRFERFLRARFDIAMMLKHREKLAKRPGYPVWTGKRIGEILNREHTSVIHLMSIRRFVSENPYGRRSKNRGHDQFQPLPAGAQVSG